MRRVPDPPDGLAAVDPRTWTPAWRRVIATPAVKCVGYAMADWADWKTGAEIRPGTRLLILASGLSKKSVIDALAQMREWGMVWRYREGSKSGRAGMEDEYRLTFPDDIGTVPMYSPDWDPPCG